MVTGAQHLWQERVEKCFRNLGLVICIADPALNIHHDTGARISPMVDDGRRIGSSSDFRILFSGIETMALTNKLHLITINSLNDIFECGPSHFAKALAPKDDSRVRGTRLTVSGLKIFL